MCDPKHQVASVAILPHLEPLRVYGNDCIQQILVQLDPPEQIPAIQPVPRLCNKGKKNVSVSVSYKYTTLLFSLQKIYNNARDCCYLHRKYATLPHECCYLHKKIYNTASCCSLYRKYTTLPHAVLPTEDIQQCPWLLLFLQTICNTASWMLLSLQKIYSTTSRLLLSPHKIYRHIVSRPSGARFAQKVGRYMYATTYVGLCTNYLLHLYVFNCLFLPAYT
jgi:hypothetical protein